MDTVFAKRSNNLVGLSTEKNGETIFFKLAPNDNFEYLLKSNHTRGSKPDADNWSGQLTSNKF